MIKWGILGLGYVASRFLPSLALHQDAEIYAAASHTLSKRDHFSDLYPNMKIYDDYEELIRDPNIDIVYIALRPADHFEWAKKALQSGKAVLCEKPATISYEETKQLCDLSESTNTLFIEAMKTRFQPLMPLLLQTDIGEIQRLETSFGGVYPYNDQLFVFDPKQGGTLRDSGWYGLSMTQLFMKSDVKEVQSLVLKEHAVDAEDHIILTYDTGGKALIELSLIRDEAKQMTIVGTKGTLTVNDFHRPTEAKIVFQDGSIRNIAQPYIEDDFYPEISEAQNCYLAGKFESTKMSHADSLATVKLFERIFASFTS